MKELKKWELMKFAYDNFQKGTVFTWNNGLTTITSTGMFKICGILDNIVIENHKDKIDYIVFDGENWAEIIPQQPEKPKSILDGKVAVQVNNEREFKLLMEHYEAKGWVSDYIDINKYPYYIDYKNNFDSSDNKDPFNSRGERIISFEDFANEKGIEVPVFVMTSEDGKDMFRYDGFFLIRSTRSGDNCHWNLPLQKVMGNEIIKVLSSDSNNVKAFSTKEAAEAWILEANKPNEIEIYQKSTLMGVVNVNGFVSKHKINCISTEQIEEIYKASKKLNS